MLDSTLIAISAAIVFLLGCGHLVLTFFTRAFSPNDILLEEKLKLVSPVITYQTTMWRSQVGFHVSHSLGVILFGTIYSYLALVNSTFFFQSHFLVILGALVLVTYLILAKLYWFVGPLIGISIAFLCYLAGVFVAYA
jgi:hypothetical protein